MIRFATDFCLILDPSVIPDKDPVQSAEAVLEAGVRFIQYRDKSRSRRAVYQTACRLIDAIRRYKAVLIINDDVDLASAVNADGVHLGQEDLPIPAARSLLGPGRIIGASVHTLEQARIAEREGADYLGVGPIFSSTTKQVRASLGCHILRDYKEAVRIPVIGIGGISLNNALQVLDGGADGVACISAVLAAPDIRKAAAELLRTIREKVRSAERIRP